MNTKEFWGTLANELNLPEDKRKVIDEVFSNEKVMNSFVPRPVFSSELDKSEKKYNELVAQNATYYQTEAQRAAANQKAVDDALALAQRYRATYGDLSDDGSSAVVKSPAVNSSDFLTKKELEELMKKKDQDTVALSKMVGRITAEHVRRFNETPDFDAIEKIAMEKGLSAEAAYKDWIQPRVESQTTAQWEEKLKKAREEGAAEARSRANVPIDTTPKEVSPFLSNVLRPAAKESGPLSTQDRVKNFAEAWNTATSTPKG